MSYLLSIIIPVFKAESFIKKCAHSLMQQSLRDLQFIFVDDKGNDESISILKEVISEYPARAKDVLILENSENLGASESRNVGLQYAEGDYVTFCDGDDWIDADATETLIRHILALDVDILWTDFFLSHRSTESVQTQRCIETPEECVKALLEERLHGALWNKIYRKELFDSNSIRFPSGRDVWEDLYTNVRLFYFAQTVDYLPRAFYHYVQYNSASLATIRNEKQLADIIANTQSTIDFLHDVGAEERYKDQIQILKLACKQTLLFSTDRKSFRKWRELYPESNDDILRFKQLPLHLRFLGKAASMKLWPLIDAWIFMKRAKNIFSKSGNIGG